MSNDDIYPRRNRGSFHKIGRKEAKLGGELFYYGIECNHCSGHWRYTSDAHCVKCASRRKAKHLSSHNDCKMMEIDSKKLDRDIREATKEVWE